MIAGFAAQALQFVGTILLARIYDADAYGHLTIIVNWASVFAVLSGLQLHIALHITRSARKAREITAAALVTIPAIAVSIGTVAYLLGSYTLVLAVILGAALAVSNIGRSALARKSANLHIAILTVGRAGVAVGAQFGLRSFGSSGLVLGLLAAEITAALAFLGGSLWGAKRPSSFKIVKVILRNKNFTVWGVAQELVSIGVVFLPILLCSAIYDPSIVGHYGVAYRLLWAPVVIMSFGFGLVFLTEISQQPQRFREILSGIHFSKLTMLLVVAAISSFFWLPNLFQWILGNEWELAAAMSPAVAIAATSFLISAPFRQLYRVHQKQRLQLSIDVATMALIATTWVLPALPPVSWISVICGIVVVQNLAMIGFTRRF
ncbi:hypothetical protein [Pelagibacterium sp. H642]|uniref:hypothetical protein n=1 Tax=Pelagibacterium sp. H642 TaxID=1881069 RepID=UPI0028150B1E|nr:hypothetical protein [Pelagibacterium sp. H642]WMT92646.1 hypothetical protein NO934_20095 [Pelagibacterium sp. H642]